MTSGRDEALAVLLVSQTFHEGGQFVVSPVDVGDDVVAVIGIVHTDGNWQMNYDLEMEEISSYMTRKS